MTTSRRFRFSLRSAAALELVAVSPAVAAAEDDTIADLADPSCN